MIGGATGAQQPPPDPVKEDKKKREYLSLFAANVAFTYRKGDEAEKLIGTHSVASPEPQMPTLAQPGAPTDYETEMRRVQAQLALMQPIMPNAPGTTSARADESKSIATNSSQPNLDIAHPGRLNSSAGSRYVVFEGTVLETLLVNRLNGTFAGPITCLLTTDIYSHDRQHVLIPAGTKLLGEVKKVEALGQQRLAIFFHRLIMSDGYSVSLDQFKGLSQIGETALRDKVNNHYLQIFGASLAIGILGGIAEAGTGNVFTNSPIDQARAGFGSNLANSSMQILDRFLNILPTVTIREGNRVKVYLSGDLLLPDYAQHNMQSDL